MAEGQFSRITKKHSKKGEGSEDVFTPQVSAYSDTVAVVTQATQRLENKIKDLSDRVKNVEERLDGICSVLTDVGNEVSQTKEMVQQMSTRLNTVLLGAGAMTTSHKRPAREGGMM